MEGEGDEQRPLGMDLTFPSCKFLNISLMEDEPSDRLNESDIGETGGDDSVRGLIRGEPEPAELTTLSWSRL